MSRLTTSLLTTPLFMVLAVGARAAEPTALTRLPQLAAPSLTAAQRAGTGLHLYRQEMLHPAPPARGARQSAPTHDFVLAAITRKLVQVKADVPTLRKTWQGLAPGEVRDCLTLFLALQGTPKDQAGVKDAVVAYATDGKHPVRLRELSVEALGALALKLQEPQLADSLAQVLREDSAGVYETVAPAVKKPVGKGAKAAKKPEAASTEKGGMVLSYPVRRAAVTAIRKLEKSGMLLPSYVTQAARRATLEVKLPAGGASASAEKR